MGMRIGRCAIGLAFIARERALRWIVLVDRQAVIPEPVAGDERPFLVGRQPVMLAGLFRQPGGIGIGVVPADLHHGPVCRHHDTTVERLASAVLDAALVIGRTRLMLHDRQRRFETRRDQRGGRLPARARKIASRAVGNRAGLHLDERLAITQTRIERAGFHAAMAPPPADHKAGDTDQGELEFECDQHGRLDSVERRCRPKAGTSAWLVLVGRGRRNFRRRLDLRHQVVVPLALDLEVCGGAEFDRLDQVVVDIGVDAGLQERVERRPADPPRMNQVSRPVSGGLANLPVSQT